MPDAKSKLTIFYSAQGAAAFSEGVPSPPTGWTETFFSSQDNLGQVLEDGKDYMKSRKELLGLGAQAMYLRASNIAPNRITRVYFFTGKEGIGQTYTNSPADNYDPTQIDLLARIEASNGKRRSMWLGGLPDSVTSTARAQGLEQAFTANAVFKQFVTKIIAVPFYVRFKLGAGPPPTFDTSSIARLIPIMVRKRDRGRPFYLYRGRRLA